MKLYTLTHIADWEGGVTVYGSHADLWATVKSDAEQVADDTRMRLPNDPQDWPGFIEEHGWKVQHYVIEQHDLGGVSGDMFDMTPRQDVLCARCEVAIRHEHGDPIDSWQAMDGGYQCPKSLNGDDHAPAEVTR